MFQLTPVLFALAQPLICDANNNVHGFDGVACYSVGNIGLWAASGVFTVLLLGYSLLMNMLWFQQSPKSKAGQVTGRVNFLGVFARVILILVNIFADIKISSIVTCIVIGILAGSFLLTQPYYNTIYNNVRYGMLASAWIVSVCSIGGAFADIKGLGNNAQTVYTIATLIIGFATIPVGFYINRFFVKNTADMIYYKLQKELEYQKDAMMPNTKVHRSQLDLIYQNVNEVLASKAKDHEVSVFPDPYWAEYTARFVRDSYLDEKAVTLAHELFEVAFEQFPKSAHLHLMYLEYIKEFLPQGNMYKNKHIAYINRRCS